ncbi:FliI/YscN family ATPase [Geminicoccaceae bacterium 1502E]|nr:FliI/YscN family ATPase [Geminicoccaceae bacterium 1502E]
MFTDPELATLVTRIAELDVEASGGRVIACSGAQLSATAPAGGLAVGDACLVAVRGIPAAGRALLAEVVRTEPGRVVLAPYDEPRGIATGSPVRRTGDALELRPHAGWTGRVVDALGQPLDGRGPLPPGRRAAEVMAMPPAAFRRGGLGRRLTLGVRALDLFVPCCEGQRLGVFAGSGVGKSSLVSMIARQARADAIVVGLIGERGREVHEFVHHALGADGLARSVVVVATSDAPAMLRRRAAHVTMAIAESLRDEGLRVLCLFDSLTRFAAALRELRLAAGEPPSARGYPPGVFNELARLVERAGPAGSAGSITGVFTVLVDGDDMEEPVADAARGLLDGHVVLDRRLADKGRFPAVDVLRSLSRAAPGCYAADERALVVQARELLAAHADMAELIQLGAYRAGSSPALDRAIALVPGIERVLAQALDEPGGGICPFALLKDVLADAGGAP